MQHHSHGANSDRPTGHAPVDESAHDHDHAHDHARGASERAVGLAALLTGGFMLAEVAGGLVSGSLALIADAGHMLTDFASLALAWGAFRVARRPADSRRTYGYDRLSVLAAFTNGLALIALSIWIAVEAAQRLFDPVEVLAGPMLAIAVIGLAVNLLSFRILTRDGGENLNIRAAALHVMGDLLGSVAAIAAALVILWTGWTPIDPILSALVLVLILRSAVAVVRESGHILLEGAPPGIETEAVARTVEREVPGARNVRHVHAWSISQERPMLTLEADLAPGHEADAVRTAIKAAVAREFGIGHATVELCAPGMADEQPEGLDSAHRHA